MAYETIIAISIALTSDNVFLKHPRKT